LQHDDLFSIYRVDDQPAPVIITISKIILLGIIGILITTILLFSDVYLSFDVKYPHICEEFILMQDIFDVRLVVGSEYELNMFSVLGIEDSAFVNILLFELELKILTKA
jgi:hypothetical protein